MSNYLKPAVSCDLIFLGQYKTIPVQCGPDKSNGSSSYCKLT
jgi:hypothetical protein